MQGFFTHKETESKTRPGGKLYTCTSCGLYKYADTPYMPPYGEFGKRIMVVGEFPTQTDDEAGRPMQGKSGRMLIRQLKQNGIDLFEDCVVINAVSCKTPKGRNPVSTEIECCRNVKVNKYINEYKPEMIIVVGTIALQSIIGSKWANDLRSIERWRGWVIPDKEYKAFVCPIYSAVHVARNGEIENRIWKEDIENLSKYVGTQVPRFKKPKIEIIEDLSVLDSVQSDLIAFDYETTGIKPHAPGHRIVCASVAVNENHVYAFIMPDKKRDRLPFLRLLTNHKVSKIAHNMKFEDTWTYVKLRTEVKGWAFDPMLSSHILDNREGISGLKFQTYVNFGESDYSSEITPYLQADSSNGLNTVHKLLESKTMTEKLLKYCALDSAYTYRLAMKHIEVMDYNFLPF